MNRLLKLSALPRPLLRSFSTSPRPFAPPRVDTPLTHPALLHDPPAEIPQDPWSLAPPAPPEEPPAGPTLTMEELLASPHPEGRDAEPTETLRKRLVYESRKRGILEMDLILGTFAKTRLADMQDRELREYDRFLTLPDWSIYYYCTNKSKAPEPWASSWVLKELLSHARNEGRTVRRMPDLENRT
ncbi:hypothetical protein RQP46_010557 [Phenoliferia psychrophenolica]